MVLQNLDTKSFLFKDTILRLRNTKGGIKKMINENVENMKADAKNAVSDIGNIMSHAKADIKANVSKAKADVKNRITHLEADAEKTKAD